MAWRLILDLAVEPVTRRALLFALLEPASMPLSTVSPEVPDPRFSNERALLEQLSGPLGDGRDVITTRRWADEFEWENVPLSERVLSLVSCCAWQVAVDGEHIAEVVVAERAAWLAEGIAPLLTGSSELGPALRATGRDAVALGLLREVPFTSIRVLPFGVPATPQVLAIVRYVAVLGCRVALSESGLDFDRAPSPAEVRELSASVALMQARPRSPLLLARLQTRLERREGAFGPVGARCVSAALAQVCEEARQDPASEEVRTMLRTTAGEVLGVADARAGDYEACELVLRALWDPHDSDDGVASAAFADDPWALVSTYLTRTRVANHRGDTERAVEALRRVREASAKERSLRMFLAAVQASTIAAVTEQNRWPFDPSLDPGAPAAMEAITHWLAGVVRDAWPGALADAHVPSTDPTLGAALGTLGRTYGFLGRSDEALALLVRARECFVAPLDLAMNAAFQAHVALDMPETGDAALSQALDALVERGERDPDSCARRLERESGFRFTAGLLFKCLALGRRRVGLSHEPWVAALERSDAGSLLSWCASQRSHPTELLARHAGEFLLRTGHHEAAAPWFALGVALGRAGGPTLQRFADFTEHLAQGRGADRSAPLGSVRNPTTEYR